ncbi:MAG: primosomal protein N' [Rikenellaceae bacterium]|nr:primosomal protein N' [Rikenellaceae bacterium]
MYEPEIFADVILPLAIKSTYTYRVPEGYTVSEGMRVTVPLGRNKYYTGIIYKIHGRKPEYKVKDIIPSDSGICVTTEQFRLWEWISEYYICKLGEIYNAAVPAKLKLSGNSEFLPEKFRYKKVREYFLDPALEDSELKVLIGKTKKHKRQHEVLTLLADKKNIHSTDFKIEHYGALKSLQKKGIVNYKEVIVERTAKNDIVQQPLPSLSKYQSEALSSINNIFTENKTVLLHGVTGSGKTEIYINLLKDRLEKGEDVLYLLPEIAVSSQLITRLKKFFGEQLLVYHSRINDNIRTEVYLKLLDRDRPPMLIIGVRSSIFLPFRNLGFVIVDEEHDSSYKQQDPAPRYHARDCAIILARIFHADVILGSATPSIESYYNAVNKKYGLVELNEKYHKNENTKFIVADTIRSAKRGEKISHFTHILLKEIDKTLTKNKQIILFQNRRGYSPYIECQECGHTFFCPDCNISMTYHKAKDLLICHYCGKNINTPKKCSSCGSTDIKTMGFGTEKIEEDILKIFPEASVSRLDMDTASNSGRFKRIISDFESGKTDILVGTQMVTKGFDFNGVTLSGVLNADNILNIPDFRAQERSFQMLVQVSGRAGRREEEGTTVIQTSQPDNPVIRQVTQNDYHSMFRNQLSERHRFLYPPFCRLIAFTLKNKDKNRLDLGIEIFGNELRHVFGRRLLGPDIKISAKIRNEYVSGFILKIEKEKSFQEAKKLIINLIDKIKTNKNMGGSVISIDVDPQ